MLDQVQKLQQKLGKESYEKEGFYDDERDKLIKQLGSQYMAEVGKPSP